MGATEGTLNYFLCNYLFLGELNNYIHAKIAPSVRLLTFFYFFLDFFRNNLLNNFFYKKIN